MNISDLTDKQLSFIRGVTEGRLTDTDAYRRAYDCSKMKETSIHRLAHQLRNNVKISSRIDDYHKMMLKHLEADARSVVEEWLAIARTDVNDIISHRRLCCRYCHGKNHAYQWKDAREFANAVANAMDANAARKRMRPPQAAKELPDDAGGYGFKFNDPPSPTCTECHGEGLSDVFIADTRNLKGGARKMYNGVKVTKTGIEALVRDRDDAVRNIAKTLGMFKDDKGSAATSSALPPGEVAMPVDQTEASRVYQRMLKGE